MEKIIPIKTRFQKPEEPFCGAITYCALTNTDQKRVEKIHKKARIKPSLGIFYLSFNKLNPKIRTIVEKNGSMLNSKDTACFDTMWFFEKSFQKLSKEKFISKILAKNNELYSKYNNKVKIISHMRDNDIKNIIKSNIENNRAVGVMIMTNLNKYLNKNKKFFIPHWITVHGVRKTKNLEYYVFNSYEGKSEWWSYKKLITAINLNRKYSFAPQFAVID